MSINFEDYGGTVWTPTMKAAVMAAIKRIDARCAAVIPKVKAEIQRVKAQETPYVQSQVLPELNHLLDVLTRVRAGIASKRSLDFYYYPLAPGLESEPPDGRTGGPHIPFAPFTWIGINSSIPLNDPRFDTKLFHELTHFFADTHDDAKRGIMDLAANLEDVYDNNDSTGIGGGYRALLFEARKGPPRPPAPPRSKFHPYGYGHFPGVPL
jgi:hypothetical protein